MNPSKRKEKAQLKQQLTDVEAKDRKAEQLFKTQGNKLVSSSGDQSLEVIGLPQQWTKEQVQQRLGDFKVNRWINNHHKITTQQQLDEVLVASWNETADGAAETTVDSILNNQLTDLTKRFEFLKKVQLKSGHLVSDLILTQATSVNFVRKHYLNNVLNKENLSYNENLPDALLLDENSFADLPNVVIEKPVKQKDIKKKYRQLLQEAKEHRESQINKAFTT